MDVFHDLVGHKELTKDLKPVDLSNKNISKTFAKIIYQRIKNALYAINSASKIKLEFVPLFNFKYQDGVPMYSFGGLYIDREIHGKALDAVEFNELEYVKGVDDVFNISIPNLTLKEIKYLESLMPTGNLPDEIFSKITDPTVVVPNEDGPSIVAAPEAPFEDLEIEYGAHPKIPLKDVEKFKKIYKFFPTFAEARIG
jgi:hypothetical protein